MSWDTTRIGVQAVDPLLQNGGYVGGELQLIDKITSHLTIRLAEIVE